MSQEIKYTIDSLKNLNDLNKTATLSIVSFGNCAETNLSIRLIKKMAQDWNIKVNEINIPSDSEIYTVNGYLYDLYCDKNLDGVALLPPFNASMDKETITNIINKIRPEQNVCGYLQNKTTYYLPIREEGIIRFLNQHLTVNGKFVSILVENYDEGQILSHLLNRLGATTVVINDKTTYLMCKSLIKQSDIVISMMNVPNFLNENMIKPGSIVLDCGIKIVKGKLMGDMKPSEDTNPGYYLSEPNAINELAIAVLLSNVRKTYEKYRN